MGPQLGRDDDRIVPGPYRVMAHAGFHLSDKRIQDCFRFGGPFIHDLSWRTCSHHRHSGSPSGHGPIFSQGKPLGMLLVLCNAVTEFSRVTEGGTVQVSGPGVQQVAEDQPDGSADHRGCTVAGAQHIEGSTHSELLPDRTVDDHQNRTASGACCCTMKRKRFLQHRGKGLAHQRVMIRKASCCDRIDG